MSLDRRHFLQLAAALNAAALLGAGSAAAQAPPTLRFGPAEPFSFDALKQMAKQRAAQRLRSAAAAQSRHRQADRLRRARQAALQAGIGALGRWRQRLPRQLPACRHVLPQDRADAHGREGHGPRGALHARPVHGRTRPRRHASWPPEPSAFAGFWVHETRTRPGLEEAGALGDLPRRVLFPRGRRTRPGRPFRARRRAGARHGQPGGIPRLHRVLVRAGR